MNIVFSYFNTPHRIFSKKTAKSQKKKKKKKKKKEFGIHLSSFSIKSKYFYVINSFLFLILNLFYALYLRSEYIT